MESLELMFLDAIEYRVVAVLKNFRSLRTSELVADLTRFRSICAMVYRIALNPIPLQLALSIEQHPHNVKHDCTSVQSSEYTPAQILTEPVTLHSPKSSVFHSSRKCSSLL